MPIAPIANRAWVAVRMNIADERDQYQTYHISHSKALGDLCIYMARFARYNRWLCRHLERPL